MNKQKMRILGCFIALIVSLIPLLVITGQQLTNQILSGNSPKILIAIRSTLDKKLPVINSDLKLQEYNQINCGEPQFPTNQKRFFVQENLNKFNDPLVEFFEGEIQGKKCNFTSSPSYAIIDPNKSEIQILNTLEAEKLLVDPSPIEKNKGTFNISKPYSINIKNYVFQITNNNITIEKQNSSVPFKKKYSLPTTSSNNSILNLDIRFVELLGEIK
ncbi:MAG: hypothetical protein ACRCXZ_03075 [Patescibacteria group bacterium]